MEEQQGRGPVGAVPRGRLARAGRRLLSLLTSSELALALLVIVLACCVAGVTVLRARASALIFSALWFNGLLVLLALSSFAAFIGRTWQRRLTAVQVGMILFHVSFAALLGGIAWNRLLFFDGTMRLTEGETLPNGRLESYDRVAKGRFFDVSRLRGETTLIRMHANLKVGGQNKRAAYEIAVDAGDASAHETIWVTEHLDFEGVRYFCDKEGYSVLLVLSDAAGRELYGAWVPLQSLKRADGGYTYAAGSAKGADLIPFPPPPERPLVAVELHYRPNTVAERKGDVTLLVLPVGAGGPQGPGETGTVEVGERFRAGAFSLSPREIRYWVGMNVRYDPGLTSILASLCSALAGMVVTFVGRVRQGAARSRARVQ